MFELRNTRDTVLCKASDIKTKFIIERICETDVPAYMIVHGYEYRSQADGYLIHCAMRIDVPGFRTSAEGLYKDLRYAVYIGKDLIHREGQDSFTYRGVTYRISKARTDDEEVSVDLNFAVVNKINHPLK